MTSARIIQAANFAAMKHTRQRRKDAEKTPYINHPIGVAFILTEAGVESEEALIGALLHDTVEDTHTTPEEIEQTFGRKIRTIVEEVTDDKRLPKAQRKRDQVAHAASISVEAKLVKLADKLFNCESMLAGDFPGSWSAKRIQGYFVWSLAVCAKLKGVNAALDARVEKLRAGAFTHEGRKYPALPAEDLNAFLERYYVDMSDPGA